jgi:hypothetical protein
VAGCCECGDEPSGSCATELVFVLGLFIYFGYDCVVLALSMIRTRYVALNLALLS